MGFTTKLDFSNNRQVKQNIETITVLSGATSFGVPFSSLPSGPNLTTTGITSTSTFLLSTFSGNSATTVYSWYDPFMETAISSLVPITLINSGVTQNASGFTGNPYVIIDGNSVATAYTGVTFDLTPIAIYDLGGGNYIGSVQSDFVDYYSATTLDFTGRTIWNDVSGITRTQELIITKNATVGSIFTCIDSEGKGNWIAASAATNQYFTLGSVGNYSIKAVNDSDIDATNDYAFAEGNGSLAAGFASHAEGYNTQANNNSSHAEGSDTIASGSISHAEGDTTQANGYSSHAEGANTIAQGDVSHAEGNLTQAIGFASHAEGNGTIAQGNYSHAGGSGSIANGETSFVHGSDSIAIGIGTIVLGNSITGTTDNTTYVDQLNIKTIGSTAFANDIRIDANGNLTTNTSDERLKENITPLSEALLTINALQGVSYQWKDRNAGTDAVRLGFIAQQVNSVDSRLVFTNPVDEYMGIHIDGIIPLLVEAVKELSSGITISNNTHLETQTILAEDNNIDLNYSGTVETAIGGGITVLHAMGIDLAAELITDTNGNWTTNNDFIPNKITIPNFTPSGSTDINGNLGNVTRDDDYLYIKSSTGWKRTNLESF